MRTGIRHRNFNGFTLIEVIIAMSLLSLILVLLFSTIFSANKSWHSTERKIEQNDELRLVGNFIQRLVSQNIPLVWIDPDGQRLIFEGKPHELLFTSTLPSHRGGGGVQLIRLKINETEDVRHLDLYYRNTSPDNDPFKTNDGDEHVMLIDKITGIVFSYYGSDKRDETPVWRDEWQNDEQLPSMISIKIEAVNENQNWPEIKIPLHSSYIKGQPQFMLRQAKNVSI